MMCRETVLASHTASSTSRREAKRIWVVADPQVEGHKKGTTGEYLNNAMNDVYYRFITKAMGRVFGVFDEVWLLGDIFSFQYHNDEQFWDIAARIAWSFDVPEHSSSFRAPYYFLAGNHDLGYTTHPRNVKRFEQYYNKRVWSRDVGSVQVVACDGMELDGDEAGSSNWKFLKGVAEGRGEGGLVLLLHIPLWKPEGSCEGDMPEIVYQQGRVVTQTTLSKETSEWILKNVKPDLVLSGHDHEGCQYNHPVGGGRGEGEGESGGGYVTEVTVRSILGDYSGNTAVLSIHEDATLSLQQCGCFRTQYILTAVIALCVLIVGHVLFSVIVMRRSRQKQKDD